MALIQTVLTLVGFGLAIWQLTRTANAAQATSRRMKNLQARLTGNDLLVALPELHKIEDEIDVALKATNRDEVERCLMRYARKAGQVVELLGPNPAAEDTALVDLLNTASRSATKAKSDISKSGASMTDIATRAIFKMTAASVEISAGIERTRRKLDDDGE